jgi:NAD(P)H-hydrate repair Nnr-like enzyme with NAD(P)H-hydrate epimerase domain
MKVVSTEQMRQLDALTIADYGIPGEELMERAGHGVALMADDLARSAGFTSAPARLVAGRGNNGGDVYVAARHLHGMGYRVEVWLAGERRRVGGDAAKQLERLRSAGIAVEEVSTPQDWDDVLASWTGSSEPESAGRRAAWPPARFNSSISLVKRGPSWPWMSRPG